MKERIFNFVQSPDGESSSKRLAGLVTCFLFAILALAGGIMFLYRNDPKDFIDIIERVGSFSCIILGVGVLDHKFKKKK